MGPNSQKKCPLMISLAKKSSGYRIYMIPINSSGTLYAPAEWYPVSILFMD